MQGDAFAKARLFGALLAMRIAHIQLKLCVACIGRVQSRHDVRRR